MASAAVKAAESKPKPLDEVESSCDLLKHVKPGETQAIAAEIVKIATSYYKDALKQARLSFYSALVAAAAGTGLFFWAAWLVMNNAALPSTTLTVIAGGLTQVISGVVFYLYNKAARQCASFHFCLERTSRFMLTNSICENLTGEAKEKMRSELIRAMANAPLLTFSVLNDSSPQEARVE
jgi:hypothetical protein